MPGGQPKRHSGKKKSKPARLRKDDTPAEARARAGGRVQGRAEAHAKIRASDARQILEYEQRLRALASELSRVEERERRRIAVDIHDRISQTLAMARMKLASLREDIPRSKRKEFAESLELLEQSLRDTRTLTFELSPPVLYELGLAAALQWLAEQMQQRHGLKITVDCSDGFTELSDDVRSLLFRATRELCLNVVKHANATAARVSVREAGKTVRLTVMDDGKGVNTRSDGQNPGFGLFSIKTRIEEIGGTFEISSVRGAGTRVTLATPINRSKPAGGNHHGDAHSAGR